MTKLADVRYILLILSALVAAGVASLLGLHIQRAHEETLRDGFRDAHNLANTLAQNTRQSFLAVDLVLQSISTPHFAQLFSDPKRRDEAYAVLRGRSTALQGVLAIGVLRPDGRLILSSRSPTPEPLDLSAEPAFIAARDHTASGLTISPPLRTARGPFKGQYIFIMSRPIASGNGQFSGSVQAVLGLDYFEDLYRRLDIGPHGIVSIVRHDGLSLIRYPRVNELIGRSVSSMPAFQDFLKHPVSGEHYALSFFDHINRIMAYRDLPELDIVVAAGFAVDDVLEPWRHNALIETGATAALVMLVVLLGLAANRLLLSREAERERTIARLNRLTEGSAEIAMVHQEEALAAAVGRVIRVLIPGAEPEIQLTAGPNTPVLATTQSHCMAMPMRGKSGAVIGQLILRREPGPAFTQQDAAILAQIAHIATVALENLELLQQSRNLAALAERAKNEETDARQQIESVFATMSEGVYVIDREGRLTFVNDYAERRLFNLPKSALLGRTLGEIVPLVRRTDLVERFMKSIETQSPAEFEFAYEISGVTRWADIRAFPTADRLTIYSRDITQRVEAEGKLRQAQKMEAIGQLTGGIAHDFNNLLTVVLGSADTLVDTLGDKPELRRAAELVRDSALRGATLVARLLAFARRQALAPQLVDVNALIYGLEDLLRRTIAENIRIEIGCVRSLWKANIDPAQMENAVLNLALNARDAMPNGGTLTISACNTRIRKAFQASAPGFDHVPPGKYVIVAVADTGAGMSRDVLLRACDPFFTTKPAGVGSGLGLSMVYGFVRQSGGAIRIHSELGHGTIVRMYLPQAEATSTETARPLEQDNTPLGHERILLVEDDELVRGHITETLISLGYEVFPCATGPEVLSMIKGGVQADLLLTDILLAGGVSGQHVADEVKQLRPTMPVLYMSGYMDNGLVLGDQLGAGVHFISKPFRRQQIAAKLRAVLAA